MLRSVYARELFGNQKLTEITHKAQRALSDSIVDRVAPITVVYTREIILQMYRRVIEHGQKVETSADLVRPASIVRFESIARTLTPIEIRFIWKR